MIKPQSLTLKEGYVPLTYLERVMFLDSSQVGYLQSSMPDANTHEWFEMFLFDHEHTCVSVMTRGFLTVEAAREALFFVLWGVKMTLRIGGVSDLMSNHDYRVMFENMWGNHG